MLRKMGLFSARALANASSFHANQSTGLCACCKRYGDFSRARRSILTLAIFVPLFALALALTWLYEKTDNLLAPIFAHSLFNAANLVALHFEDQLNQLLQKFQHFLHLA
jgi:membrane protease YdiL (CAAX protease family)